MTIASYTELVSEMGDWLNRSDLSAKIPTFVRLFEARMNRRLRNPDMEITFIQAITPGQNTYTIPSTIRQVKHVCMAATPRVELVYMPWPLIREAYPNDTTGTPAAYAIRDETIFIYPFAASGNLAITGYSSLSALDTGNATNWLLDDHPDAYLFGSLCMAEGYLKDDQRLAVWKQAWDEALSEIIAEANRRRIPSGVPLASRPAVCE